jgi:hypothetical protein
MPIDKELKLFENAKKKKLLTAVFESSKFKQSYLGSQWAEPFLLFLKKYLVENNMRSLVWLLVYCPYPASIIE